MGFLNENFQKVDDTIKRKDQLEKEKIAMELVFKEHELFSKYLEILKDIEMCDKELEDAKTYLYEGMLDEDIDFLDGQFCNVTLKKPYYKRSFNMEAFTKDYKPESKMYKKYIKTTLVKGNINLKKLTEDK